MTMPSDVESPMYTTASQEVCPAGAAFEDSAFCDSPFRGADFGGSALCGSVLKDTPAPSRAVVDEAAGRRAAADLGSGAYHSGQAGAVHYQDTQRRPRDYAGGNPLALSAAVDPPWEVAPLSGGSPAPDPRSGLLPQPSER